MYRRTRYPQEVLQRSEVNALIGGCSSRAPTGIRNRALIVLLYRSGLRISDALRLFPENLDRANQRIWVKPQKSMGYWAFMDDEAFEALEPWLARREKLDLLKRSPLFCTLKGKPMRTNYVRAMVQRLKHRAQIKRRVHVHAFRHTFASELAAEGVPITDIRDALGHHNLATTSVYIGRLKNANYGPKTPLKRESYIAPGQRKQAQLI